MQALSRNLGGKTAASWTTRTRRGVLHHVLNFGVDAGALDTNPIPRTKVAVERGNSEVDPRVVLINADDSVSATLKDKLLQKKVTLEVYHGISDSDAAQMFVDLNYEGTPVDTITKANIDPRNRWVSSTKAIFKELGINYATTGRQLTASHRALDQWILLTHAEQMVKAIALGPYKALANSKKPDSWDEIDFDRLHDAAVTWFGEIFNHFHGPQVLGDKSKVIRTIAVRVALASLGSAFYRNDAAAIAEARRTLKEVNWDVSEAWNGIGGKVSISENGEPSMSAGSGKESITKAVQAVTRPDTVAGRAIRAQSGKDTVRQELELDLPSVPVHLRIDGTPDE